ncbi:hypothetical protein EDB84DRAFT_1489662 [Lactarius hengduanensis]|nr:hypothetical protein EDB84DRAFT_1489662 [Lactarius hengduanensis]
MRSVRFDKLLPPFALLPRRPHRTGAKSPFSVNVIATFKELTGFRRKGMGYNRTHLGRVLHARSLSREFGS